MLVRMKEVDSMNSVMKLSPMLIESYSIDIPVPESRQNELLYSGLYLRGGI